MEREKSEKRIFLGLCVVALLGGLNIAPEEIWIRAPRVEAGEEKGIKIKNTSEYVGNGSYNWTVYIDEDATTLNRIDSVEYTLHPTFPQPVRKAYARQNKFALSSSGWGEFTIYARVFFSNRRIETSNYRLRLTKATSGVVARSLKFESIRIGTDNSSKYVGDGRWDWTVFLTADDSVLSSIRYVEYTLHPTFPNPVRRVSDRGTAHGRGFFLSAGGWGTFKIGVKVVFVNGSTRSLTHELKLSP